MEDVKPRNSHHYLDPVVVLGIYESLAVEGKASCQAVADRLAANGVTTRKGKPPTRQGIHFILKRSIEGRELLNWTKKRIGKAS